MRLDYGFLMFGAFNKLIITIIIIIIIIIIMAKAMDDTMEVECRFSVCQYDLVSSWILTSCQPHRVISGVGMMSDFF